MKRAGPTAALDHDDAGNERREEKVRNAHANIALSILNVALESAMMTACLDLA